MLPVVFSASSSGIRRAQRSTELFRPCSPSAGVGLPVSALGPPPHVTTAPFSFGFSSLSLMLCGSLTVCPSCSSLCEPSLCCGPEAYSRLWFFCAGSRGSVGQHWPSLISPCDDTESTWVPFAALIKCLLLLLQPWGGATS